MSVLVLVLEWAWAVDVGFGGRVGVWIGIGRRVGDSVAGIDLVRVKLSRMSSLTASISARLGWQLTISIVVVAGVPAACCDSYTRMTPCSIQSPRVLSLVYWASQNVTSLLLVASKNELS